MKEPQIKLIMIDYLKLMNASGMLFRNRGEEVNVITRSLKAMPKELNISIIAFSQLNRGVENRDGFEERRSQLGISENPEVWRKMRI